MNPIWTTIAAFSQPIEAHVLKTKLESEGIRCFIADENLIGANWLYSNALGGVKLQVRPDDLDRARAILDEPAPLDESVAPDACPKCGSTQIKRTNLSQRVAFVAMLLAAVPVPFARRKWTCLKCEYRWRGR